MNKDVHVRVVYDPETRQILRVVIPDRTEELDLHHKPMENEKHVDMHYSEYEKHIMENGMPHPHKLIAHIMGE